MLVVQTEERATSILELLTHQNPPVHHPKPHSSTLTNGKYFHFPREVREWKEFNFETLKDIYGGALIRAARRKRSDLLDYPAVFPDIHCEIRVEEDTKTIYEQWTQKIVMAASIPVMSRFHPVIWKRGDVIKREDSEIPAETGVTRTQPARKSSHKARKPKKQSLYKLRPDSGSMLLVQDADRTDAAGSEGSPEKKPPRPERFPKEYKSAAKWKSEWLWEYQLIDDEGHWGKGQESDNYAYPIRQAYSYCIQALCRYGCILTCHEAFIFRVSPRNEDLRHKHDTPVQDLEQSLISNGVMEYVSIPWDNHREAGAKSHSEWTINLALWVVHVLAGNKYEADWSYDPLKKEILITFNDGNGSETDGTVSDDDEEVEAETEDGSSDSDSDEEVEAEIEDSSSDSDEDEEVEAEIEDGSSDSDDSEKTADANTTPYTRKRKRDADDGDDGDIHYSFSERHSFTS